MGWHVAIDVGGTFTDLVATDAGSRPIRLKVASTPHAPDEGLLAALRELLRDVDAASIERIDHAGTIATNALLGQLQLDVPRVAFITTAGFRDVLEIGRQARSAVYDLHVTRPVPLARRDDRFTVRERIDYDGSVHEPLDAAGLALAVAAIRQRGIGAVAIGFLNSHVNDAHERAAAAVVRRLLPDVALTVSSELVREEREYERFSTAVVNAALQPLVSRYLAKLAAGVYKLGITAPIFVMQSNGGTATLPYVAQRPATLIESGPAAGVIGAAAAGARAGLRNVLSFDMGGTTAKAGTIVDGAPEMAYEFEAAGATHSGRGRSGSGYPVRFPFIDLAEVSAGGGTIARLDAVGVLRVGPLSAGADPGPACYGRGVAPTVTDANVVLGRLNPVALLGGAFPIDAQRARDAVASVAAPLGGDVARTAAGIVALVDAEMAKVLRIVSVERGLDPRDFTLMAFGGGGPLHACALAADLGMRRVIVPPHPGVFSAAGLLAAGVRISRSRSFIAVLDAGARRAAQAIADELIADARAAMLDQHVAADDVHIVAEADLRYAGQSFDLTVPFAGDHAALADAFHEKHRRRYGYSVGTEPVEIAAVRITAHAPAAAHPAPVGVATPAASATRAVWDDGAFVEAAVFAREALADGTALDGPAVVEQYDTTTWVPRGWRLAADPHGNLVIESANHA